MGECRVPVRLLIVGYESSAPNVQPRDESAGPVRPECRSTRCVLAERSRLTAGFPADLKPSISRPQSFSTKQRTRYRLADNGWPGSSSLPGSAARARRSPTSCPRSRMRASWPSARRCTNAAARPILSSWTSTEIESAARNTFKTSSRASTARSSRKR